MFNRNFIFSALFAGVLISIGGLAFLKVGGIVGAILFTFGLISIISYKYKLYTGTAGYIGKPWNIKQNIRFKEVLFILLLNIIGCFIVGYLVNLANNDIYDSLNTLVESRLMKDWYQVLILAIGCGYIMTTVVEHSKFNDNWKPLIYGIPLFIMCGMYHSIADAFYFSTYIINHNFIVDNNLFLIYLYEVVGNFIGCNIYRLVENKNQ